MTSYSQPNAKLNSRSVNPAESAVDRWQRMYRESEAENLRYRAAFLASGDPRLIALVTRAGRQA